MHQNMVTLLELTRVVELLDRFSHRRTVDKALETAGLNRKMFRGSKGFAPYAAEAVLIETVARAIGDRHLGAKIGRDFDYMTYGAYSTYVLSAPDLVTALDRGRRALLFIHPGSEIVLRQTETHLVVGRDSAGLSVVGHRHLDEGALFVISQVAHHFLGKSWRPDWVELPDVRNSDLKELQELIETEIRPDCRMPSIAIRVSDLYALNPKPPQSREQLTLAELGALMEISPSQTTVQAVQHILDISMDESIPDEESVARLLAIGPRTLQRALKSEGTSFRDIRLRFLVERAQVLLTQTELPISDVAKELGYSNPRAFRRAFKKITGLSPVSYRGKH